MSRSRARFNTEKINKLLKIGKCSNISKKGKKWVKKGPKKGQKRAKNGPKKVQIEPKGGKKGAKNEN